MADIERMTEQYVKNGYSERNARARVCQDIILKAIEKSNFGKHVTIKGGVVMRSLSGDVRRATEDIDIDFIRYSLEDDSIRRFIDKLNCLDGIMINIKDDQIQPLSQQEYRGKRVFVVISDDSGHSMTSKMDIGVHSEYLIDQEEYCFDVCLDEEGASLLINSSEQIFTEKLKSFLRFGQFSTRYKDLFDLYYLEDHVDIQKLKDCIKTCIFDDPTMKEDNMDAVRVRISSTLNEKRFRAGIESAGNRNWVQVDVDTVISSIEEYLKKL